MKRFVPLLALALTVALPSSAFAARHTAGAAGNAMSPAGVTCAAGDPVVWINTESKVYHMAGSSYYGKTKHGKYACASDATKLGAHAAKRESGSGAGSMGGTMGGSTSGAAGTSGSMSSGTTSSGTMSTGKHHRHRGASPMPAPNPT